MDNEKEKIRGLLEKGMTTDYSTMEKIKAFWISCSDGNNWFLTLSGKV